MIICWNLTQEASLKSNICYVKLFFSVHKRFELPVVYYSIGYDYLTILLTAIAKLVFTRQNFEFSKELSIVQWGKSFQASMASFLCCVVWLVLLHCIIKHSFDFIKVRKHHTFYIRAEFSCVQLASYLCETDE